MYSEEEEEEDPSPPVDDVVRRRYGVIFASRVLDVGEGAGDID